MPELSTQRLARTPKATRETTRRAQIAVARRATDPKDLAQLLDMLGLTQDTREG